MPHLTKNNQNLVARVRRIAGQIGAVERGLESGVGCSDILQLVAAVRGAVNGLMDEIIAEHLKEHVAKPGLNDHARETAAAELLAVIRRYSR